MKQRDISIDILKFFAVLFITNSHMDVMYEKFSGLATGGSIGDSLFFFASGFTILLGGGKKI
jgi:peptidoglycan/LPS O-acetylase OafA/YrhL